MDIAEKTLRKLDTKYMVSNLDAYRSEKSTSAGLAELFNGPVKMKRKSSGVAWMVVVILILAALGIAIFSKILG